MKRQMIQALRHQSSESHVCASVRRGMVTEHVVLLRRLWKKYANKMQLLSLNCETLFYTFNFSNATLFSLKLCEKL